MAITKSFLAITATEEAELWASSGKYRYLVVRDGQTYQKLPDLRAKFPDAEIYVYKDLSYFVEEPGDPYYPYTSTGVSWRFYKDEWALYDKRTGKPARSSGFPASVLADLRVGKGYIEKWVEEVGKRVRDSGYDGVFADDTNLSQAAHGLGEQITGMTDAEYCGHTVEAVKYVASRIPMQPNLWLETWRPDHKQAALEIAKATEVVMRESFLKWGSNVFSAPHTNSGNWDWEVDLDEQILANGGKINTCTYGNSSELAAWRYARCSFFLIWDGKDGSAQTFTGSGFTRPTPKIGLPKSQRRKVGVGWIRDYTKGAVIVNPHPSTTQDFSLGGGTVSVKPRSGLFVGRA